MKEPQTIVLAGGTGGLGHYLREQLSNDARYRVAILTRQKNLNINHPNITVHTTDYSESSLLSILNSTSATTLISTINCPNKTYLPLHTTFLTACRESTHCKRFIPSEWAGDIESYPGIPRAYGKTRAPFRKILKRVTDVEWTLFNYGWCMEYFLPESMSHRDSVGAEFPIDPKAWTYCVRGTGEEPQAWTCGRDVARAVAELLSRDEWEPVTYIAGQWGTFNEAAAVLEKFYGRPFTREYRSLDDINLSLDKYKDTDSHELAVAEAEEWTVSGATACPQEKTRRQHEKFFPGMSFLSLEEMLRKAEIEGRI